MASLLDVYCRIVLNFSSKHQFWEIYRRNFSSFKSSPLDDFQKWNTCGNDANLSVAIFSTQGKMSVLSEQLWRAEAFSSSYLLISSVHMSNCANNVHMYKYCEFVLILCICTNIVHSCKYCALVHIFCVSPAFRCKTSPLLNYLSSACVSWAR